MDLRLVFKYTGLLIFLLFFQILILDNIQVSHLGIRPYMYLLLILLLPFETPKWTILLISIGFALIIDVFNNTPGLHSSATVFMGFIRPLVLNTISPRDGYEGGILPRIHFLGFNWFLKYSFFLILAHHIVYFFVDEFSFQNIHITFLKIILSTIFSTFFIVISQYFIFRKE